MTNAPAVDLAKALELAQGVSDSTSGTGSFMTFNGKTGALVFGTDKLEVEEDSKWAVNPRKIIMGFQCWGNMELLGEETADVMNGEAPVMKGNLPKLTYQDPKHGETVADWKPYVVFEVKCLSGDDEGEQCLFSGSSYGFNKMANAFIKDLSRQVGSNPEATNAVVTFGSNSYKGNYGTTHNPEMNIVEFVGDLGDIKEPAPQLEQDKPAEEPAAEEPKTETPTRRRTRK